MATQDQMLSVFSAADELTRNALVAFHKPESPVWREYAERQMEKVKEAIAAYERAVSTCK